MSVAVENCHGQHIEVKVPDLAEGGYFLSPHDIEQIEHDRNETQERIPTRLYAYLKGDKQREYVLSRQVTVGSYGPIYAYSTTDKEECDGHEIVVKLTTVHTEPINTPTHSAISQGFCADECSDFFVQVLCANENSMNAYGYQTDNPEELGYTVGKENILTLWDQDTDDTAHAGPIRHMPLQKKRGNTTLIVLTVMERANASVDTLKMTLKMAKGILTLRENAQECRSKEKQHHSTNIQLRKVFQMGPNTYKFGRDLGMSGVFDDPELWKWNKQTTSWSRAKHNSQNTENERLRGQTWQAAMLVCEVLERLDHPKNLENMVVYNLAPHTWSHANPKNIVAQMKEVKKYLQQKKVGQNEEIVIRNVNLALEAIDRKMKYIGYL
jgi:hypothetical protein